MLTHTECEGVQESENKVVCTVDMLTDGAISVRGNASFHPRSHSCLTSASGSFQV